MSRAGGAAFWIFFGFGAVTVALALGGGIYSVLRFSQAGGRLIGVLLVFLGASLAVMLGTLLLVRGKGQRFSTRGEKG